VRLSVWFGRESAVGGLVARLDVNPQPAGARDTVARVGVVGVNHLAFRTQDPDRLRRFYLDLTGADELDGAHSPIRIGQTLLVFFTSEASGATDDPDEIAFDVDRSGFDDVLERAGQLGCEIRGPVEHTAFSMGFYLDDPDGRRLEFVYDDRGVYWRE